MLLRVDFKSGVPVYRQLVDQIKSATASGQLRPGESLPAVGSLAEELRVSRNNVVKAYSELESFGVIELVPGKGYCLKEHHAPLRKEVLRTESPDTRSTSITLRRTLRATLAYALLTFLLGALYFAIVSIAGVFLVHFGVVRGEIPAILATVSVACVFLPLRNRAQRAVELIVFRKRHRLPIALQSLKSALWTQPGLDSYLDRVIDTSEEIVGVRPRLVRDRGEVLELVNSFPALRSAREPVAAGNDFLMPLFSHDEVLGVLHVTAKPRGQRFDPEDMQFLGAIGEQIAIAAGQFRMRNEKLESEYALDIQRALLPRDIPQPPGFTIAGAWHPAKLVGGDYYDVFPLADDRIALIVADVAGKGVPAALLMSNVQAMTKAYATTTSSPRQLCSRVNRAVCASISTGRFVTFFIAVLDTHSRRLTYTNAGHNRPLLASVDGSCRRLAVGGLVLGLFADATFEEESIDLAPGDRLVIFTDGIIEAEESDDKEFGDDRLFTVATSAAHATATELRDSIMQAVTHFCHGDFADDATLLVAVADEST